jgi:hypothetical protein
MSQSRNNLVPQLIRTNSTRHVLLESAIPKSPETPFFLDSSSPATPLLTMSSPSSYCSSPTFTPSTSSPATPVTDNLAPATLDWPMPLVSEELFDTGVISYASQISPPKTPKNSSFARNIMDVISSASTPENQSSLDYDLGGAISDGPDRPTSSPQSPHKRQRSGESGTHTISRFTSRLPSFSKKWRHRKNSSLSTGNGSDFGKPNTSSRASSLSGCEKDIPSFSNMAILSRHNSSAIENSPPNSPFGSPILPEYEEDPIDRMKLSTTPLLPPKMVVSTDEPSEPYPSQCNPRAEGTRSSAVSVENQSATLRYQSLSAKPSIASFQRSRKSTNPNTDPLTSLVLPTPDKWSNLLGHANFTIHPEPYSPETYDRASCLKLAADWEVARAEWFLHQARTLEHYGPNSQTYKLTDEKWAEVEAEWQQCIEQTTARVVAQGESLDKLGSDLPKRIPKYNPYGDGKFPGLGDQTIVGVMETVQQTVTLSSQTRNSSASKLFKLGSIFNRSLSDEK